MIIKLPSGKKIKFPRKRSPEFNGLVYDASAGYKTLNRLVDAMNGKYKFPPATQEQLDKWQLESEKRIKKAELYNAFRKQFEDTGHEVWDLHRDYEPYGFTLKDLDVTIYYNEGKGKRPHTVYLPSYAQKHFKTMAQFNKIIRNKQNWATRTLGPISSIQIGENLIAKNLYESVLKEKL